jgi:hypothetical protein
LEPNYSLTFSIWLDRKSCNDGPGTETVWKLRTRECDLGCRSEVYYQRCVIICVLKLHPYRLHKSLLEKICVIKCA